MPVVTEHLDQWVREGFLSGDQATAIREYEDPPSHSRPTAVLEVLGYVGAVFVLVAGLLLVVELWTDMSRAVQAALAGSAAAVLTASGVVIAHTEDPRIRRVGASLLLLALVPMGVAVGLIADMWFDEEAAALSGFLAAAVLGLLLYVRDRQSVAQHAGLFAASMGTVLFAVVIIDDAADWVPGLALFLAGIVWIMLASFEILMPRSLGEVLGAGAALFGSITMVGSLNFEESGAATLVMVLAIVASLVAVGFGVAKDRILVVVAGMLGLVIYLPWLINETLGENVGAPIALLVAGILLIASAVYLTRRRRP
jgi:hypothetical protein